MTKEKVSFDEIETFLEGRDPQKYIVAIEASYQEDFVYLIINDPDTGKRIERHSFKPFLWMKHDVSSILYGGKRGAIREAMSKYKVKIKEVRTSDSEGVTPKRLEDGYKFMVTCKGSYGNLLNFFRQGGVDIYSQKHLVDGDESTPTIKSLFVAFSPAEQFLIQSGKRLFKGMDDYNDIHRFQFDLETTGLEPRKDSIFQIGIKDNRGYEEILETKSEYQVKLTKEGVIDIELPEKEALAKLPQEDFNKIVKEKRDSERINIIRFFDILSELTPDLITGYNDANFDWPFFKTRCERLSIDIEKVAKTLSPEQKIRWRSTMLKLGAESEAYEQTMIWGTNVLDISHSVRKAQAINSNIKRWSLKYITQYSGVAKANRVYVPGDKLHKTWSDPSPYAFNDVDGDWYKISEERPLKEGYNTASGAYIVQRYLLDDLWETEQVDAIYNQAAYLIAKILPTSYMRSSTMGTAGQWKLIMAAWSYERGLGIPSLEPKRPFVGGLSRLVEVGYAKGVVKLDFAALYPKTQLTWGIFPSLDISGVMEGLLTYVVDKRDEFKFLMGDSKKEKGRLQDLLDKNRDKLTPERIVEAERMIKEQGKLASNYDKKQLPLKILANSFFGAYGAPYIFNWGDTDCAEETTCRGRQSLRLMVKHFTETHGFRPLVGDTDGFNFAMPDHIDTIKYVVKASHWKTSKYVSGTELSGLEAVLADFNETYMEGRMGLDIDDVCESTINFARKNYGNLIDGKTKLVGNTLKSKAMPVYIEDFINKGVKQLLDGQGYEFIEWYYQYVEDIYSYRIPVAKIASKSRVKMTIENYNNVYCKQKNKAGNGKARQAHMELINKLGLKVNLGDTIHYLNTGTAKSHSDIKAIKDKETKQVKEVQFNCKLIPQEQLDNNPDLTTDGYNVAKYLAAFNKRVEPLLVCFDPEIRNNILINLVKDKKTKVTKLEERSVFTRKECELMAGSPNKPEDQDTYEALMTITDNEIRFWDSVNKLPNFIEQDEWDSILVDYKIRMYVTRLKSFADEKLNLIKIIKRLEIEDLNSIEETKTFPKSIEDFTKVDVDDTGKWYFHSKKCGLKLIPFETLFKYKDDAIDRRDFYLSLEDIKDGDDLYDSWVEHKLKLRLDSGVSGDGTYNKEYTDKQLNIMSTYLISKGWSVDGWNGWIRSDMDYNSVGSFQIGEAYNMEKRYEDDLISARDQIPADLILNIV